MSNAFFENFIAAPHTQPVRIYWQIVFVSDTQNTHVFPPFSTEPDMASKMIPNNMKHRRTKPRVNATAEVRAGEGLEPP